MKSMKRFIASVLLFLVVFLSVSPRIAEATCPSTFHLIDFVNWNSIFPISIAGISLGKGTDNVMTVDSYSSPICVCPMGIPPFFRIGLSLQMWEPARMVETVGDPGCFPSMGFGVSVASGMNLAGTQTSQVNGGTSNFSFAQAHYFIYPIFSMLGLFIDWSCMESAGMDIAYMTEFDPLWQDDSMSAVLNPEAVLFGNLAVQLACVADSASAAAGLSLSPLFWCMGSWGSAYPLTGHIEEDEYLTANAGIAARMLYKMAREMLVCDTNINMCSCVPTPIWVKHNYKFQEALPVTDHEAHPIGRTDLMWGSLMQYPEDSDYVWMIFRRRNCCAL